VSTLPPSPDRIEIGRWCILLYEKGISIFWGRGGEWTFYETIIDYAAINVLLFLGLLIVRRDERFGRWLRWRIILPGAVILGVFEALLTLNCFDAAHLVVNITIVLAGVVLALASLGTVGLLWGLGSCVCRFQTRAGKMKREDQHEGN